MAVNRLMKASDKVLAGLIIRQDEALRRDGFEAPWIKVNDNGTKYAEKKTKTEKGHDVLVRTYMSKTNPKVSYARTWYGQDFTKKSENYFVICDTQDGRKVYYKPVRQDRYKNEHPDDVELDEPELPIEGENQ